MLHETFNLAMLRKLTVVFICENNNYAMGTSIERTSNVTDIYKLADAYDMPADVIDGMIPELVHEGVARAVKRGRDGEGPTLLEMKTYRYKGHSVSDPQKYRTKEEVEDYKNQDPITKVRETILENGYSTEADLQAIDQKIDAIVEQSVKFAEESPWPDDSEVLKDVYLDENYPFIVD
jgi:pyruvate dehydrogenase E1 component alpha subunit